MKPGAVIHATIAIRGKHGLVGGSATFVLKRGPAKDGTWEATLMAMDVYDEAGKRLGRLPSETSGGWRIPFADEAGGGKP